MVKCVVKTSGLPQERGGPFPEMGVFAPPSPFFKNVECVRETEILVEQQSRQGVLVCDHAGLPQGLLEIQDTHRPRALQKGYAWEQRTTLGAVRVLILE